MVAHTSQEDLSGYSAFSIHSTVYKSTNSHDIDLDVFIPKNFTPPPTGAPIILRFHGGGLITGSSLTPLFFPQHLLDLATLHSAIIVSPNYRLLPEATPNDILTDTEDAWQWLHTKLTPFLQTTSPNPTITPNLSQILLYGESAGGYLALQLSLTHPTAAIRALAIAYPMVDLKSPWFSTSYPKQILDFPQSPRTPLDDHITSLTPTSICTDDLTLTRISLMLVAVQHGLYPLFFPSSNPALFPLERLARGEKLPPGAPVLVLHGNKDSLVPVEHSRKLRDAVLRQESGGQIDDDGPGKFALVEKDGDHGFDGELKLADEEWLREAWAPVVKAWLA